MRLIFFGTSEWAVSVLSALAHDPEMEIALVVTTPDRPAGRKQKLTASPVKRAAEELGLSLFQPATLKSETAFETLRNANADIFVVVSYGKLIPERILGIPRLGCVNVHPSLLPKYRGPSPITAPILAGDVETGITIMLLDEGMDTGPILAQTTIPLDPRETQISLTQKISEQSPPFLIKILKKFAAGDLQPNSQDHTQSTVTKLLSREDGRVDWHASAEEIDRQIRAFTPWPGTWTLWTRGKKSIRLKIPAAIPADETSLPAGRVSIENNRLRVACSDRFLEILTLQPEGASVMTAEVFLRGYSDVKDACLD